MLRNANFAGSPVRHTHKVRGRKSHAALGVETRYDDGPFRLPQDLKLVSGFAKWTGPLAGGTLRASATGYHVEFRSPEQVPLPAVGDTASVE